jgi:hypothetical protein
MKRRGNNLLANYEFSSSDEEKEAIYWQTTSSLLVCIELVPAFSSTLKPLDHLELQHKVDHQALLAEVQ